MLKRLKVFIGLFSLTLALLVLGSCVGLAKNSDRPPASSTEAIAQNPSSPAFRIPLNCSLGKDCFVLVYPDRDPGTGFVDFGCGRQTYDGHDGTDFGIPNEQAMAAGVPVVAAAPGRVLRVRDRIPDRRIQDPTEVAKIQGVNCGNGMVIDHGNGWETQYCHLRQGSVVVQPGTQVEAGTVLGMVGASGEASFPHVHLTVRYQGKAVDPFVGVNAGPGCQIKPQPLWGQPLPYVQTGLINAGFATEIPNVNSIWAGQHLATELSANAPLLVFWVHPYGILAGDVEQYRLIAPNGTVAAETQNTIPSSNRINGMNFIGKKNNPDRPLIPGTWRGEYRLTRNNQVLIEAKQQVELR